MTMLYAQPYDISATGFYFDTPDDYHAKADRLRNAYGEQVEECEIQFIDGDGMDVGLFNALGAHQDNFVKYLEPVEEWSDDEKIRVIIAVNEAGYRFDLGRDEPDRFNVNLYKCDILCKSRIVPVGFRNLLV